MLNKESKTTTSFYSTEVPMRIRRDGDAVITILRDALNSSDPRSVIERGIWLRYPSDELVIDGDAPKSSKKGSVSRWNFGSLLGSSGGDRLRQGLIASYAKGPGDGEPTYFGAVFFTKNGLLEIFAASEHGVFVNGQRESVIPADARAQLDRAVSENNLLASFLPLLDQPLISKGK